MAQPNSSEQSQSSHLASAFTPTSVPMEHSISSSSISSSSIYSAVSTATSAFTAPSPNSSGFYPATPQRKFQEMQVFNNTSAADNSAASANMKKPLDISNLMSPPEPDQFESFSGNGNVHSRSSSPAHDNHCSVVEEKSANPPAPKNGPLSPPISPKDRKSSTASDLTVASSQSTRDPILYPPVNDVSSTAPPRPLFAPNEDAASLRHSVVHNHVAARSPTLFCTTAPPRGEDYELALYFKSEVMNQYTNDPSAWLEREREQLVSDRKAVANRNRRLHLLASSQAARPILTASRPLTPRVLKPLHNSHGSTHPQSPPQHAPTQRHVQQRSSALQPVHDPANRVAKRSRAPAQPRTSLPQRIAPQVNGSGRHASGSSSRPSNGSPEPRVRTAAPNREDKDFMALPDYCPPLSTLPERTNNLKVDWKGTALDLSRDPHLHLLHRDEVGLAASLRLDCATYLTSKRRIFIRRLECSRIGKEFRKTDAQQACKIDVNKASKLWTAYEKVGWLRPEHMLQYK